MPYRCIITHVPASAGWPEHLSTLSWGQALRPEEDVHPLHDELRGSPDRRRRGGPLDAAPGVRRRRTARGGWRAPGRRLVRRRSAIRSSAKKPFPVAFNRSPQERGEQAGHPAGGRAVTCGADPGKTGRAPFRPWDAKETPAAHDIRDKGLSSPGTRPVVRDDGDQEGRCGRRRRHGARHR